MQEILSTKATVEGFQLEGWEEKCYLVTEPRIAQDLEQKVIKVISDAKGRYIIANIKIQGSPYVLVNCYAPNTETGQIKTFQDLTNHLSDLDADPECNYIFDGDWNLIFDTTLDSMGVAQN